MSHPSEVLAGTGSALVILAHLKLQVGVHPKPIMSHDFIQQCVWLPASLVVVSDGFLQLLKFVILNA